MNLKKHLIPGLLLSVTLLSLASVSISLAWFNSGAFVRVENIYVHLAGDPSLELGVKVDDEIKFFEEELDTRYLDVKDEYVPVSSMFESKWIDLDNHSIPELRESYDSPTYLDETTYTSSKVATSGFNQFTLYLRSDKDIGVTLDKETTFIADETRNRERARIYSSKFPLLSEDEIYENLNNIKYSMRYSLYVENEEENEKDDFYIIDPYKNEDTYFAGPLDLDGNKSYDTYKESGKEYEFVYGEYENKDKIIYDELNNTIEALPPYTTFNADKEKGTNSFNWELSVLNGFDPKKENSYTVEELEDKYDLIVLKAFEPKKIILSIYIEGWDKDNTNLSSYGAFESFIKFKVTREIY